MRARDPDVLQPPTMLQHARHLYTVGEWTLERFEREVDALIANGMADYRAPSWSGPFDLPVRTWPEHS
jgi:hypothetical protein